MTRWKIVETDNYAGDYPDESFVNIPPLPLPHASAVAKAINAAFGENHHRYWMVKPEDYQLQPGFEP